MIKKIRKWASIKFETLSPYRVVETLALVHGFRDYISGASRGASLGFYSHSRPIKNFFFLYVAGRGVK